MKCEYVEIVFGRSLTVEELEKIAKYLDENIIDDYFLVSYTKDIGN